MAISDFRMMSSQRFDALTWGATEISGSTIAHSTLGNPLTGEGGYCRYWNNSYTGGFQFLAAPNISNFKSISSTKAVSMRVWMRASSTYPTRIGLVAKGRSDVSPLERGYNFFVNTSSEFGLNFGTCNVYTHAKYYPNPLSTPLFDNWVHMRMDVVPVKNSSGTVVADRITCYANNEAIGSQNWILVADRFAEVTVPTGITSPFKAWSSANEAYYGFGVNNLGQYSTGGGLNYTNRQIFYADHFEMFVKTL